MCGGRDCPDCLTEPSVGFIIESIESFDRLSAQEKAAYIRGANQYAREKQQKNN
jgi:hypothetical protein